MNPTGVGGNEPIVINMKFRVDIVVKEFLRKKRGVPIRFLTKGRTGVVGNRRIIMNGNREGNSIILINRCRHKGLTRH